MFKRPLFYSLAVTTAILLCLFSDFKAEYRLAKYGAITDGSILKVNCAKRSLVTYGFIAEGRTVIGKGTIGYGTPPCRTLQKGDKVKLSYLPQEPFINGLGEPSKNLKNHAIFWGVLLLILSACTYVLAKNADKFTSNDERQKSERDSI